MPSDASGPSGDNPGDNPGDNIPLQGTHRGEPPDDPLTSSVRAQEPPEPTSRAEHIEEEPVAEEAEGEAGVSEERPDELGDYRLSRDPDSGRHRLSLRPPAEEGETPGGGFREVSRHSSAQEMSDALDGQLSDGARFLVLENTDTGAVYFDREGELSDNLFEGGRFDQVTVFESEDEAAAYADRRRQRD